MILHTRCHIVSLSRDTACPRSIVLSSKQNMEKTGNIERSKHLQKHITPKCQATGESQPRGTFHCAQRAENESPGQRNNHLESRKSDQPYK